MQLTNITMQNCYNIYKHYVLADVAAEKKKNLCLCHVVFLSQKWNACNVKSNAMYWNKWDAYKRSKPFLPSKYYCKLRLFVISG